MTALKRKNARRIVLPAFLGGLLAGLFGPLVDPGHPIWEMILAAFIMSFSALTLILSFENLIKARWLKKWNFLSKVLFCAVVDVLIIFFVMVITIQGFGMQGEDTDFGTMIFRTDFIMGMGVFAGLALLVQFFLQVNTLLGPGVLVRFLFGQFHTPREFNSFLLFLDLKGSTTIAEKLGSIRFLSFLNDFFFDVSEAVEITRGEIYKYVGDEAIIVWGEKKGVRSGRCGHFYFLLSSVIKARTDYYLKTYGQVPQFKAGLHFGPVAVGEMGHFRKEIAYIGDTVNTAARIEGECNRLNQEFIASSDAIERLGPVKDLGYNSLGKFTLRGKAGTVELFSVSAKTSQVTG